MNYICYFQNGWIGNSAAVHEDGMVTVIWVVTGRYRVGEGSGDVTLV